jgi:LDH2 family malate/lactate/ureidoglycolate dehydrogenase
MNDRPASSYPPSFLKEVAGGLLIGAGTPPDIASQVAELLVWSERIGHSSHGLLRVGPYLKRIREGLLIPGARPSMVKETDTTTLVDGNWGFGQVTGLFAAEQGITKAMANGVSVTGAYHINHVGRLGDFTEKCAGAGLVSFLFVGGAPTGVTGNVAPYGGRKPIWGTNPLAIAVPTGDGIFSLDFATSVIAGGKAAAARAQRVELEDEFLIDVDGRPTRDPWALERGGAIQPFGGHKGYGLAFAVELLAGAMVGALAPELGPGEMHNGLLLIVIDPNGLGSAAAFEESVAAVIERVKASPPAGGFDEVLVPGEPERRRLARSDETGIRLPPALIDELSALGAGMDIDFEW